jgi:mannose-1-phosphate guanylyltransferase
MDHDRVRILRGDFGWSDIGTWDTLHDRLSDQGNNVVKGTVIAKNTHGSLVYAAGDRLVAAFGLQDVMIVDTPDALLVCHKRSAEHLKELLAEIKEQTGEKYL